MREDWTFVHIYAKRTLKPSFCRQRLDKRGLIFASQHWRGLLSNIKCVEPFWDRLSRARKRSRSFPFCEQAWWTHETFPEKEPNEKFDFFRKGSQIVSRRITPIGDPLFVSKDSRFSSWGWIHFLHRPSSILERMEKALTEKRLGKSAFSVSR